MNGKLRALSLFSGVGSYDLGLERTGGYVSVGFVENNPYCQKLLDLRFPRIPIMGDIREFDPSQIPGKIDIIHGGFPCQDISSAGRGAGIEGERSSLWSEFARCICVARPRYAVVENVPALKDRGLGVVLGSLAFGGYDAEWDCLSALSLGCLYEDTEGYIRGQRRDRIWMLGTVPDTDRERLWHEQNADSERKIPTLITDYGEDGPMGYANSIGWEPETVEVYGWESNPSGAGEDAPYTHRTQAGHNNDVIGGDLRNGKKEDLRVIPNPEIGRDVRRDRFIPDVGIFEEAAQNNRLGLFFDEQREWWAAEPGLDRVAAGVANRVDRLRCIGNSNPPQAMHFIGELILERERKNMSDDTKHQQKREED